jgi:hypothetical protein
MGRIVIAFGHKKRRGKDTAAQFAVDFLNEAVGPGCARLDHFAHSLKEGILRQVFGFSDNQLYGDLKETIDNFWGFTPRWALQTVGTELMRDHIDQDIWAKTVYRRFIDDSLCHVIIGDLRFPNEMSMVKRMGGYTVRVDRDVESEQDNHSSETSLEDADWDFTINNNGTLEELKLEVKMVVNEVGHMAMSPDSHSKR